MSHMVEFCPMTKLNGGLSRLHSANEDAVLWLTSYGSWHAYEKEKINKACKARGKVFNSRYALSVNGITKKDVSEFTWNFCEK